MSTGESRAERQDRMLDEFADLAMELGRDMAGRAKKAETDEQRERCIFTFDRMYRAVRLSIALSRRLKRDEAREQSHHRAEAVDLRKAKLRARLRSEIRAEDVSLKIRCDLERELDDRLAEDALYQSFLDLPLNEAITHLRDRLGLEVPPPQGEGDREAVEGVAAHCDLSGLQPPHRPAAGAPPEGEQLWPTPQARAGPS
jgi:hypothetical protein